MRLEGLHLEKGAHSETCIINYRMDNALMDSERVRLGRRLLPPGKAAPYLSHKPAPQTVKPS